MKINGWRYYKHAAIPTTAPHEEVNMIPIDDGSIWKIGGGRALFARWTSDFDCGFETNWWYTIIDKPFDIAGINAKKRYEINKGCKNFDVKIIDPYEYAKEIYEINTKAYSTYSAKYVPKMAEKEAFIESMKGWRNYRIYGAFSRESGELCGYIRNAMKDAYIDFMNLKVDPAQEKKGINAALVYGMLLDNYEYLSSGGYICDGERNILHETKFGEYLEKYFNFRKAYCHLHLVYLPQICTIMKVAYPMRKLCYALRGNRWLSYASSILMMEEIAREQRK